MEGADGATESDRSGAGEGEAVPIGIDGLDPVGVEGTLIRMSVKAGQAQLNADLMSVETRDYCQRAGGRAAAEAMTSPRGPGDLPLAAQTCPAGGYARPGEQTAWA